MLPTRNVSKSLTTLSKQAMSKQLKVPEPQKMQIKADGCSLSFDALISCKSKICTTCVAICALWAALPVAHALPHRPQAAPTGSSGPQGRTGKARLPAGTRSFLGSRLHGIVGLAKYLRCKPQKSHVKLGRQSKSTIVCQESGLVSPRTACKFIS